MSRDPWLLGQYVAGNDVHNEAARTIYGEEFTPLERQICKSVNFSQIYGGTPESAAEEADMDKAALRYLSEKYHIMMARLYQWRREQFDLLREQGYVATCTGRRRRAPIITRANQRDMQKMAVNTPVQGSASELTLISFMEMWQWIKEAGYEDVARLLLTVHDSVLASVVIPYVPTIARRLREIMTEVGSRYFPEVPWVVKIEAGESWGEVKELVL